MSMQDLSLGRMPRWVSSTVLLLPLGAVAADCQPCVSSPPRLMVDDTGAATGRLEICNRGTAPVGLSLVFEDFATQDVQDKPFWLNAGRSLSAERPDERDLFEGRQELPVGRCTSALIQVTGLTQAGVSLATISQRGKPLVTVQAVRHHAPFRLQVDGENPNEVRLQSVAGNRFVLKLVNPDAMAYRFRWTLELPGLTESQLAVVRPNRAITIPVEVRPELVSPWDSGFLRSATLHGRLVLEHEPGRELEPYPLQRQVYPVTATISSFEPSVQKLVNFSYIMAMLLLGILASLLISYALPMQRRRVQVKQRLAQLEGRLLGLRSLVPAPLLAQLRVEKRRLREELRSVWPIDPTADVSLPKLENLIERIEKRITLVAAAGEQLAAALQGVALAVPQRDAIRVACQTVFDVAAKAQADEGDLQRASSALATANDLRGSAGAAPTEPMLQDLRSQAGAMTSRLKCAIHPENSEDRFRNVVEALSAELAEDKLKELDAESYVDRTLALARAGAVVAYLDLVAGSPSQDSRCRRLRRAPELLDAVCPGPEESLDRARSIVQEVEQGVSACDLVDSLKAAQAGDVFIEVDPPRPGPYQRVSLQVRMLQPGLDVAVARSRVKCEWFVDGVQIEGEDWTASCFFAAKSVSFLDRVRATVGGRTVPTPDRVVVTARLMYRGTILSNLESDPIEVEPAKSYAVSAAWLSLGSLLVTMLLVGLGMVAGAQEKIQSLDWVTGVFTLLGLGFGADILKRVLARPG